MIVGSRTESVGGGIGGFIWSGIGGSASVPAQTGTGTTGEVGNGTAVVGFTGDAAMIHRRVRAWEVVSGVIIALCIFI